MSNNYTPQRSWSQEKLDAYKRFNNFFKQAILKEIERQGMTKSSFAKRIGKEPSYVHRSLRPENDMRISTIFNFADMLGMKWDVRMVAK